MPYKNQEVIIPYILYKFITFDTLFKNHPKYLYELILPLRINI